MEELVSKKLEAKLWEIPGVEDVYSVSMNSMAVVTVKFYVGQDKERSMVKLYDKLMSNMDFAPPGGVPAAGEAHRCGRRADRGDHALCRAGIEL